MNNIPHLTYLAQVRRTRRICAYPRFLKHPRHVSITLPCSLSKGTAESMEFRKVVVIHGRVPGAGKLGLVTNTDASLKEFDHSPNIIKFTSSRLHVVVEKLRRKRLMMDMENGQIDCWMLGDYRVSVLGRNGLTFRSQNVKREGIHIRTSSRHFAPLTLFRMAGSIPVSPLKDTRLWATYRHIRLTTSKNLVFGQDWARSMTLHQRGKSKPLAATWLNIYSRTTFLTRFGLRTGDEYVTPNPFLSSQEAYQILLSFSKEMTGNDYQNWRSLFPLRTISANQRLNSG